MIDTPGAAVVRLARVSHLPPSLTPELAPGPDPTSRRHWDVFMLGWEFPPFISGGLGAACYGLTRAMSRRGDRVLFVMPGPTSAGFSASMSSAPNNPYSAAPPGGMTLPDFDNVTFRGVGPTGMTAYGTILPKRSPLADPPHGRWPAHRPADVAAPVSPLDEVARFTARAVATAEQERDGGHHFDVVHAHDWTTLAAGRAIAARLGVPLVAHVHSTEYDRAGELADPRVMDVEGNGLCAADAVIAVSEYTAEIIADRYGVEKDRLHVVHNAADADLGGTQSRPSALGIDEPIVLFVGRLTRQKNPLGFIHAAAKVVESEPRTRFVIAGSGDLDTAARGLVVQMGLENHFLFAGFLKSEDVQQLYAAADVLVLPSMSEPFGLAAVEAMRKDVPVITTRNSGVSEVAEHLLLIDSWDTDELASRILSVLTDETLRQSLGKGGGFEVRQMRWSDAAEKVAEVYAGVASGNAGNATNGSSPPR